jgi:asparagine synthase (glutamine-hydrolysing)
MCRIAGIWNPTDKDNLGDICISMRDVMCKGGPDDAGLFVDEKAGLSLGHRRLSIIDLSQTGHQPMTSQDGRYTICYNGEVYNFRELRLELGDFIFHGSSDTEVVLNAFIKWGTDCVKRFNGMFAFAVWDSLEKALYLFRDRMGVKPLFYYASEGVFAFASELKGLHAGLSGRLEIDDKALGEFFHYGYISTPRSIYKNVFKLEPGCFLKILENSRIEQHRYWDMNSFEEIRPPLSEESYIEELDSLMIDAFKKRLIADVPVGVFLSGGVDSSLVTAILARHSGADIKTFTIGFNEKNYDESPWAKMVANYLGTSYTEEIVTPEHARAILPLWPEIYDEPFGDISGIPTTIVSQITRQHVKVSLSADGGDELFCGYHRYWVMNRLGKTLSGLPASIPRLAGKIIGILGIDAVSQFSQVFPKLRLPAIKDRFRKFHAVLENWQGGVSSAYPFSVAYWLPDEIRKMTGAYSVSRKDLESFKRDILGAMMLWDMKYYLPDDILTKVDRATMFTSLEGREPLLDHRIVEFALKLPMQYKFRNGQTKYILKKLLAKYIPDELFDRPKQGFAVPVYSWLHDDMQNLIDTHLNPDTLKTQQYIDSEIALRTVQEFRQKKGSIAVDRIWLLLVFMMWHSRYCKA